jgi:curved DNA-binding protein CbpA
MSECPDERDRADHYGVLGVPVDASSAEVARAFRRLARSSHPDARPGDAAAAERMRQGIEAYEVLRDPSRRAGYDAARRTEPPPRPRGTPVRVRVVHQPAAPRPPRPAPPPPPRPPIVVLDVWAGGSRPWFDSAVAEQQVAVDRFLADVLDSLFTPRRRYFW